MRKTIFFSILLCLLSGQIAMAQSIRIFSSAKQISTDDVLQIKVQINGAQGRLGYPSFPNVPGFLKTFLGTEQSMGSGGTSLTYSQTYQPQKAGTFKIPAFSYQLKGQKKTYPGGKIKVTKGTGKKRTQNSGGLSNFLKDPFEDLFRDPFGKKKGRQNLNFEETKADYFLSFDLDKTSCYLGELVTGEVVLYVNEKDGGKIDIDRTSIAEMQQRMKNSGFWQETFDFYRYPIKVATVNGKKYKTYTLYKTYLFPLNPGNITFKDLYLDAQKLYVAKNATARQRALHQNRKYEPIRIQAQNRNLFVKALPKTGLPNANVAGQYKMQGGMSSQQLNTGEVLALEFELQGNGNMAMTPDPQVNFPESFNFDSPTTNLEVHAEEIAYFGKKSYRYEFVPTRSGNYDLGPVKFYFFNPDTKSYDSLVIQSIPVKVTGTDLENINLRQNKEDHFYKNAMLTAKTGFGQEPGSTLLGFLGCLFLITAAAVYNFYQGKTNSPEKQIEREAKNKLDD